MKYQFINKYPVLIKYINNSRIYEIFELWQIVTTTQIYN